MLTLLTKAFRPKLLTIIEPNYMMYKTRRKLRRGCSIEQRRQRLENNTITGQVGPGVFACVRGHACILVVLPASVSL